MRNNILIGVAIGTSILVTASYAATLSECSSGSSRERVACVQRNVAAVNSELIKANIDLQNIVKESRSEIAKLSERVKVLEGRQPPDLSGFVKTTDFNPVKSKLDDLLDGKKTFQLKWRDASQCMQRADNHVQMAECHGDDGVVQYFMIRPGSFGARK